LLLISLLDVECHV